MEREILSASDMELVAEIDGRATDGGIFMGFCETLPPADVIIDFSNREAIKPLLDFAVKRKIPAVIATTGHTARELKEIERASRETAIFKSGNMSLGVYEFIKTVGEFAKLFPYADVEIVETHHKRKKDAPSGTAKMLADEILRARGGKGRAVASLTNERQYGDIGISSLRYGEVLGMHEVIIDTGYQRFTFKHEALSKALFIKGAARAMRFIVGKETGLYGMSDMIEGKPRIK